MSKKIKEVLSLLFFFIPFITSPQSVINLQECLRIGIENNYDLRIARNEEMISDNNVTPGNAGFLPDVNLNSGYSMRSSNTNQSPSGGGDIVKTRNSGTQALDASVNLSWTLFEGFRVQTNYKRLQELQTVGELNTRLSLENLIANLTAEYYNYVQQQIRLGNLQYAVALSRERLRIVEARYQVGSLSRLDLQQARVYFNADSSQLIQQYEILNRSRIRLNELMGVDVNRNFMAEDTTILFDTMLSQDELLDASLQQNTLLLLTQKNKTLSELELKKLQSRNYPYLRLNTGYGFTNYNYNTGSIDRQRNWGPSAGLTLGYTLFDGFNRRREQKNAKISIQNRELEIDRSKLAIQSDFANMWMAYQNNIELAKLESESLENAELNYEIAMERYKIGDLSGLELREAQNSLLEAEQRLLTAQYNTKLYEISLLQISGKIGRYLE
ncbi:MULTISPECIES: TolC family protein [Proteiniphilum]|jgi:outer membrane protein TolC|uniref:TolC family protein n=1 Tax=Proteiniphilum TaxID=294702 RepID=UPI001EEB746E|nr:MULTISPECIES: TolC family protein [Proteiniphilum]ULB33085.1 TolC family protein [Proteiniphilum propionicum]